MDNKKKCSNKKHSELIAINYCPECKIYLCNKCSNNHSDLLENHLIYNLEKNLEEIFTDICSEPEHKDKLLFYCKDHNKLCCAACLSKIKVKGNGEHFNCNVCLIEEIKDEKKNKLNENIKYLEDFSEKIDNLISELKILFQKISESKEELKLKISNLFTKIRNAVNEREDELLLKLENIYDKAFFKEALIKNGEKIPIQIKIYKEKGKKLIKEWDDDNNKLNIRINDCINIENNIKSINQINESKEELKLKISNLFTKLRNTVNEREDELLLELENIYDKWFFKEDLIKNGEKIPKQIKIYKAKGKKLIEEWDDDQNKLKKRINDCVNIENNIKSIIEINESIDKCKSKKIDIHFYPEEEVQINEFLEKIIKFGEINDEEVGFKFKFKPGNYYNVTNNGLIATKNNGGDDWNCIIIGDKEIPKNKISKWKIKIKTDIKTNYADFYIGIGPNNFKGNFCDECWSLYSHCSTIKLRMKGKSSEYNNHKEKLKKNDIIEVIVDRKLGNLSFSVNDINYGIACSNIPKEESLYPTIVLYQQNHIVEIV